MQKIKNFFTFRINNQLGEKEISKDQSISCIIKNITMLKEMPFVLKPVTPVMNNLTLQKEEDSSSWLINYYLVSKQIISSLNLHYYKGKNIPTDILTFPYSDIHTRLLGEIFICPDCLPEKAQQKGEPIYKYCVRLIIHGFLHLLLGPHSKEFDRYEDFYVSKLVKLLN